MKAVHRTVLLGAVGSLVAATLIGCAPAPWEASPSASPSRTPTAVPTPVPNDLSSGSTERTLVAGAITATIDYWSTLNMDRWDAAAIKPISLSMTTLVEPNDGKKVFLQRATMTAIPSTPQGALPALEPQVDAATVNPGYLVLSPQSYSQTFNVGPVPEEATYVTLQFSYDFLMQSTPTSSEYAKQTATDTITVALSH